MSRQKTGGLALAPRSMVCTIPGPELFPWEAGLQDHRPQPRQVPFHPQSCILSHAEIYYSVVKVEFRLWAWVRTITIIQITKRIKELRPNLTLWFTVLKIWAQIVSYYAQTLRVHSIVQIFSAELLSTNNKYKNKQLPAFSLFKKRKKKGKYSYFTKEQCSLRSSQVLLGIAFLREFLRWGWGWGCLLSLLGFLMTSGISLHSVEYLCPSLLAESLFIVTL